MSDPTLAAHGLGEWSFAASEMLPLVIIVVAYLVRYRTLRRKRQAPHPIRVASFMVGMGVLVIALATPIDSVGEGQS